MRTSLCGWRYLNIPKSPSLPHESQFIADQSELATQRLSTTRFSAPDELPPCIIVGEARIPSSEELSELEVRFFIVGSGNTSSGIDKISAELLVTFWKDKGPHVTHLFRACLRSGYHLTFFKLAEIVFLPKPRRDPSSVKECRLSIIVLSREKIGEVISKENVSSRHINRDCRSASVLSNSQTISIGSHFLRGTWRWAGQDTKVSFYTCNVRCGKGFWCHAS